MFFIIIVLAGLYMLLNKEANMTFRIVKLVFFALYLFIGANSTAMLVIAIFALLFAIAIRIATKILKRSFISFKLFK
ncbi:hypothetical protein COF68_05650 [Bacillus toyonensis]|uniref:hypothetical protein n=1 Tax=Bacillus toyonensis TaxID=155322 RepID=UPI000BFD16FD|nr:hypothetical protein [Bacillus toyonensis]PHE64326.1 hypothetical protein COF68_05650 [Bacillus toyonensis]